MGKVKEERESLDRAMLAPEMVSGIVPSVRHVSVGKWRVSEHFRTASVLVLEL